MEGTQLTPIKNNEEFHALVNALAARKMYGEVVFYIQAGNIESCRISERLSKSDVKAMLEKERGKQPRVLEVTKRKDGGNV